MFCRSFKQKITILMIATLFDNTFLCGAPSLGNADVQTGRVRLLCQKSTGLSPEFIGDDFIRAAWKFDGSINRWCISVDSVGPP
jgi:hypothetical protein